MTRSAVVIDTNVLIAASGRDTHVSPFCALRAVRRLNTARNNETVLLDTLDHIFQEYKPYMNFSGQPTLADEFFKYIHEKRWDETAGRILQIPITENSDIATQDNRKYQEFPDDPRFSGFDRSDQKFVAVAVASGRNPAILNAADNLDWENYRAALSDQGISLEQICPDSENHTG